MSNQRKPGKKLISSYVWENDKDKLKELADKNGVTMSDLIKAMISELDSLEQEAQEQIINAAKETD